MNDIKKEEGDKEKPTILVVTPEITYLPEGMGNMAQRMRAKAGGMADVSASLVSALYDQGADVHVALPNYRRMFHTDVKNVHNREYHPLFNLFIFSIMVFFIR